MCRFGCCKSFVTSLFPYTYCSLNQFSFCRLLLLILGLLRSNVSLNFRMVLFLYTFQLNADFITMRNNKKSFSFLCLSILVLYPNYSNYCAQFLFSVSSISMRNVALIELILNVLHASSTNKFQRKTMNSGIFVGSTIIGIIFKMRFVEFVRVNFDTQLIAIETVPRFWSLISIIDYY